MSVPSQIEPLVVVDASDESKIHVDMLGGFKQLHVELVATFGDTKVTVYLTREQTFELGTWLIRAAHE